MKVLIDTNVLLSSCLFKGKISNWIKFLTVIDDVYISTYSLDEFTNKVFSNIPCNKHEWKKIATMLEDLIFEHQFKIILSKNTKHIYKTRDPKDDLILNSAIQNGIDLLVTGDRDLLEFKTNKIKIVKFNEWLSIATNRKSN